MKTKDIVIGLIIAALVILYLIQKEHKSAATPTKPTVNLYLNVDRSCADAILDRFEKESNVTLFRHYDFNGKWLQRLIRSKEHDADLYWSEDPIEAMLLKERNLTRPYRSPFAETIPARFKDREAHWTGLAGRLRLLITHRGARRVPTGIEDFIHPLFKGHGVLATPLHGSQRVYVAALLRRWGPDRTEAFLRKLKYNVKITSNDQISGDLVAQGRYDFTLIDSDDALRRIRHKEPLITIFPDQNPKAPGTLVIPDSITLLRKAPHPKAAKKLFDYLLRPDTAKELALRCGKLPLQKGVEVSQPLLGATRIKTMEIDYNDIARQLPALRSLLHRWSMKR